MTLPSKDEMNKLIWQDQINIIYDYLIEKEKEEAGRFGISLGQKKKKK